MGYPHPTKVEQNNNAMFQSVKRRSGPTGLVSFLSLMLALLCTIGVITLGSVSLEDLFNGNVSDSVTGVLLFITLGALFLFMSLVCAVVGAIEGSWWAAATLITIFLPVIIGLVFLMGTSGAALVAALFAA